MTMSCEIILLGDGTAFATSRVRNPIDRGFYCVDVGSFCNSLCMFTAAFES